MITVLSIWSRKKKTQQNYSRKYLRNINSISGLGKSGKKSGLSQIYGDESGTVLENQEAADYMNNYYLNAGSNLAKVFDDNINTTSIFRFDFVIEDQVRKLVKNIDIGKSSAIENLS